jgi:hypothetical protein
MDPNESPCGMCGLEAAGFREAEYGEFVADGCRVIVHPTRGKYEVDVILPGGGGLGFDVASFTAGPPRTIPKRQARFEDMLAALDVLEVDGKHDEAAHLRHEIKLLRPYLLKGMNKEEAVAAYYRDHPEDAPKRVEKPHDERDDIPF